MKWKSKSVLHIVNKDITFRKAVFLSYESSEKEWKAFLLSWTATYVGYADTVVLYQGPQFRSLEFQSFFLSGYRAKLQEWKTVGRFKK